MSVAKHGMKVPCHGTTHGEEAERMSSSKIIHLYSHWRQGTGGFAGIINASGLCGAKNLLREQMTVKLAEATCPRCLAKAKEAKAPKVEERKKAKETTEEPIVEKEKKRGRSSGGEWPYAAGAVIKLLTSRNPTKPGTAKHKRWSILFAHNGKTWEEYRDAGGNPDTLKNALKSKDLVELVPN
jgi:hypothetical protein